MNNSSVRTLSALYPMENKRLIKNYARFVDHNPEWVEDGFSLLDYKKKGADLGGWSPKYEPESVVPKIGRRK